MTATVDNTSNYYQSVTSIGSYYQCQNCHQWVSGAHYCSVPPAPLTTDWYPQPVVYKSIFYCALCGTMYDLTEHGSKHVCHSCRMRLLDEAIAETQARRNANQ